MSPYIYVGDKDHVPCKNISHSHFDLHLHLKLETKGFYSIIKLCLSFGQGCCTTRSLRSLWFCFFTFLRSNKQNEG